MLSLVLMPSCWGKNPRTSQVGMDLETSSPLFVEEGSLFSPCPVMFCKASSDGDSATSMERLSQSFLIFTMEKNSCIKVKPLLVQLVPAAPCLHNVAPCAGRASIPSGAAAQSGHCEQLTPQGKRVASNLPKINNFHHPSAQRVWKLTFAFEGGILLGGTLCPPLSRADAAVVKAEGEGADPERGWCCCSFYFICLNLYLIRSTDLNQGLLFLKLCTWLHYYSMILPYLSRSKCFIFLLNNGIVYWKIS